MDTTDRELLSDQDSVALPSFEMTEPLDEPSPPYELPHSEGYLAPRPAFQRLLSPPKTPASKLTTSFDSANDSNSEWNLINNCAAGNSIPRPESACSSLSDSSTSSYGSNSTNSYPSFGGSCTSPESDAADPFSFTDSTNLKQSAFSPVLPGESPVAKRVKRARDVAWTPEMDKHLWVTYLIYIQDPRITPWKTLPGSAPPLGVCHRVAREARRAWKGNRTTSLSLPEDSEIPYAAFNRGSSPDTIRPDNSNDSDTPTAPRLPKALPSRWPSSDSQTRKRLRYLCKKKPELSAHYHRLMQTRSPSPFQSSSPRSRSSHLPSSSFSSRSMNVALTAATAPSMQADGPLARLSSDVPTPQPQRSADWFARIGRSQAHQKSRSLQISLGMGSTPRYECSSALASPFDARLGREDFLHSMSTTQSLGRNHVNNHRPDSGPALNSPLELHAPIPNYRSLKRRFRIEEEGSNSSSLQDIFAPPPAITNMRGRSRGYSLSAMSGGPRDLSALLGSPPPPAHRVTAPSPPQEAAPHSDVMMSEASEGSATSYLAAPPAPAPRLGSPFAGTSSNARFNTFPRRFAPPMSSTEGNLTFEQKIRELAAQHQNVH